jgi:hypothetical protein
MENINPSILHVCDVLKNGFYNINTMTLYSVIDLLYISMHCLMFAMVKILFVIECVQYIT